MNKKHNFLIFALLIFIFSIWFSSVNAATTTCEFSDLGLKVIYDEAGTSTIEQTKYEESSTRIPVIGWFYTTSSGGIEYINELAHIEKELYGSCPEKIYACAYEKMIVADIGVNAILDDFIPEGTFLESISGTDDTSILGYSEHKKLYLFYSEDNMKKNNVLADLPNDEKIRGSEFNDNFTAAYEDGENACGAFCGWAWGLIGGVSSNVFDIIGIDTGEGGGVDMYYEEYKNCQYVNYVGNLPTYNLACPNLNLYLKSFNAAINEYKDCAETDAVCISQKIKIVNEEDDKIKRYCRTILENHNFDGGTEQQCLEACMDIAVQTKKAKVAAGLEESGTGDCGVSKRMIVWITNILRWIKYILPVAVIIFGILDFMKAMGADKEDEMKKAQSKFIRRLIAAALVFIIPLIIEFVLDKMGFGYNDCGLF